MPVQVKKTYAERLAANLRKQAEKAIAQAETTKRRGAFLASVAESADDETDIEWAQNRAKSMIERGERNEAEKAPLLHVDAKATQAMLDALSGNAQAEQTA